MKTLIDVLGNTSDECLKNVDKTSLATLLEMIASKFIENDILQDGLSLKSCYKDSEYLSSLDSKKYLLERNQLLLAFINGCCKIKYQIQEQSLILFSVSIALELFHS